MGFLVYVRNCPKISYTFQLGKVSLKFTFFIFANFRYKRQKEKAPLVELMSRALPLLQERLGSLILNQEQPSCILQKQILKIFFCLNQVNLFLLFWFRIINFFLVFDESANSFYWSICQMDAFIFGNCWKRSAHGMQYIARRWASRNNMVEMQKMGNENHTTSFRTV